jgi:hypothetical protein
MLATLYAKALDADFDQPRLGDRWAKEIVERLDYDWTKTSITVRSAPSVNPVRHTSTTGRGSFSRCTRAQWCCTWGAGWTAGSSDTFTDVSWPYRVMAKVMSLHPAMRYMAQYHRCAF